MGNYAERILDLMEHNGGIATATQITEEGIPRRCLTEMNQSGVVCKIERGVYALPDTWEDEFFLAQYRFSRGVFSHETALYLHSLTDRTPSCFTMTFPNGYNNSNTKIQHIVIRYTPMKNYELGISEVMSPGGHRLKVYDAERTLCDILKARHKTDIHVINQAMKRYLRSHDKNIAKLIDYAERCEVKQKVLTYLEVLL